MGTKKIVKERSAYCDRRFQKARDDIGKLAVQIGYGDGGSQWVAPDISVSQKVDALYEHLGLEIAQEVEPRKERIVVRRATHKAKK